MFSNDVQSLRALFEQSIIEHGSSITDDNIVYRDDININELTLKILVLPEHMKALLFARYLWKLTPSECEDLYSISHAKPKLRYVQALLAFSLRLPESHCISDKTMGKAVSSALDRYMEKDDTEVLVKKPRYSKKFRKALKEIKAVRAYDSYVPLRRIGITVIAAIIGFVMTLTVSAGLRERFFHWIVETFPLFSQFSVDTIIPSNNEDFKRIKNLSIQYIPNGFALMDTFEVEPMVVYNFENSRGQTYDISVSMPNGSPMLLDSENKKINGIEFKEQPAYWWEKDDIFYFIWQQGGFECSIIGQISYDEAVKTAENIKI